MRLLAIALLFISTPFSAAVAQKPPVRMQMETMSIRGRSGAAIPVRIKLEHEGNQLLEGDLLLTVYQSEQTASDILVNLRYEGIVLQGTDYFMQVILPPVAHSWNQQYLITAWFETADGKRISLSLDEDNPNEPRELLTPFPNVRTSLVCSCSGQVDYQTPSTNLKFLNRTLSLNNYAPEASSANLNGARGSSTNSTQAYGNANEIRYYAAAWDALDLPENPLHLTCFDVVLLADRALGRLEASQLDALKAWVDAGGSLCLLADKQPLKSIHESFLKTLFESPSDPSFQISRNKTGQLEILSESQSKFFNRRYGLGAISLISAADKLEETFTEEDKGRLVGHLWNVRHNSSILKGEPWLGEDVVEWMKQQGYTVRKIGNQWNVTGIDTYGNYINDVYQSLNQVAAVFQHDQDLSPQQNLLTSAANTALMPDGVRMVPAWVIATLLVAYVLAIGPLDYWLLGLLKARKFTWILFPVTTAFFTGLTIMIAHAYMSSTETGGQVSIIDVVDNGRLVRETSLQMNFYGASTTAKSQHKQAFYVPAAMSNTGYLGFSNDPLPSTDKKVINLSGRFPQNYQSEVSLSQWDPFLTRTFRLQPEVDRIPEISWNNADLVTSAQGRQKLATELNNWETQNDLLTVDAIVMHQSQIHRIQADRPTQVFDSSITRRRQLQAERDVYGQQLEWQRTSLGLGVVEASTWLLGADYYSIVSQIAPTGDASLEDLPIADLTDPNQWLLIIAVKEGNQTNVFRKLFRDTPKP
ncbi:MAG: hypothetical protein ABJZ55_24825 [Fuerstiella sp.]